MKHGPDVEDLRLWAVVTATVRPLRPARRIEATPKDAPSKANGKSKTSSKPAAPAQVGKVSRIGARAPATAKDPPAPAAVDARLHRRLVREREPVAARIDLHGLNYDDARAALTGFILRAADQGWRAVLVITGKGNLGEGVIRRHAPEWLAASPLRQHVAGLSQAHRRHGGEGALYVALKRKT
jgi:DNA-nicking Smr family endonuclease